MPEPSRVRSPRGASTWFTEKQTALGVFCQSHLATPEKRGAVE